MLQDNLTDEMVVLAKQLKESSLMMSQSLQNTEKVSKLIFSFNPACLTAKRLYEMVMLNVSYFSMVRVKEWEC